VERQGMFITPQKEASPSYPVPDSME